MSYQLARRRMLTVAALSLNCCRVESRVRIRIAVHDETIKPRNFCAHLLEQCFCVDLLSRCAGSRRAHRNRRCQGQEY